MRIKLNRGEAEDGGFILSDGIHVTKREIQALIMVGLGFSNSKSAEKMKINETTFRNHVYNAMKKLRAKNRAHAIVIAVEKKMIEIESDEDYYKEEEYEQSGYEDKYVLCIMCGRVSLADDYIATEPDEVTINHITYEMDGIPKCPYEDCNGNIAETIYWKFIREKHPEYPENPVPGIVYDYDLDWYLERNDR